MDDANSGALDLDTLVGISRDIVDAVQLGTLGQALDLDILGIDVQEPMPEPESMCTQSLAFTHAPGVSCHT